MTMKKDAKRNTRKKLTLSKETIRDLTPDALTRVKGGARADTDTEPLNPSAGLANTCNSCVCG